MLIKFNLPNWFALACLASGGMAPGARAAGFPEPPIVFYGSVTNDSDGYSLPIAIGELRWTITPEAGEPLVFTTPLEPIGGGLSYRLEIPVEKVPAGFTLTVGALAAPANSTTYTRDPITLDGEPVEIVTPTLPGGLTFSFAENQRGRIERVNLAILTGFLDTDGDGVPDWYEELHQYDIYDPTDFALDDDFDSVNVLGEYRAKSSPRSFDTMSYPRWATLKGLTGADYPMTADIDFDGIPHGIEFAVDANPHAPDRAFVDSRLFTQVEEVNGKDYLVMTLRKPSIERSGVLQVIEASTDLEVWGSVEDVDVVTLRNDFGELKMRLKNDLKDPNVRAGFLRFRVVETP